MSVWFSKNLGDAMLAWEPLARIEALSLAAYAKAGSSEEMAVFMRHESEGRIHCELIVYFSPAASELANAVDAGPCERPSAHGLGLLAGSEDCWSALFPGHGGLSGIP